MHHTVCLSMALRYDLRDMTTKDQKTLDHLLRQALRNRELRERAGLITVEGGFGRGRSEDVDEPIDWDPHSPVTFSSTTTGRGSVVYHCFWWGSHSRSLVSTRAPPCARCSRGMMSNAGLCGGGACDSDSSFLDLAHEHLRSPNFR